MIDVVEADILVLGAGGAGLCAALHAAEPETAVGSVMEVTLSVDHRAVDGSTAAEWMRAFVATIQHPTQILL